MGTKHVFKDEVGNRYERLLVVEYAGRSEGKAKHPKFRCICDCGNEVVVLGTNLRRNHSTSCGCMHKEKTSEAKTTHGMRHTPTYKTWCSMKERCLNSSSTTYEGYGSVGISICQEWIDSFESFFKDMGERPEGTTLDRIDVNGNYAPDNCRWADGSTQAYNKNIRNTNTSGKTGVSFSNNRGKWVASITINYDKIYLGSFSTLESAIIARKAAELKYYGYNVGEGDNG